ncbi:GNAT family N-acetyltransferase [Brevibacillus fluminis]|uniref:GNAT family N-acetyltransferase n=1 Tax=Brevibacillus fluminis TaxID=511487 RepID=UPI003F8A21F6
MPNQIYSERLTFTKLAEHDWELVRSIYSNQTLMQHIGATMTEEAIRLHFEKELAPWSLASTHWLTWIIRENASGNDVGFISMCTRNREILTAEIGFIFLDAYKGKGYATEAVKHMIDFATKTYGFKKFTAVCSEEHAASRRVLEKVGMKLDKIVPDSTEINGKMVTDCFYSLEVS